MSGFDSPFEGLWVDKPDWEQRLDRLLDEKSISDHESEQMRQFVDQGYLVLPNAITAEHADRIRGEVESITDRSEYFIARTKRKSYSYADAATVEDRAFRLIDFHVNSTLAQEAQFAPSIRRFLSLIFENSVLAFQSLTFIYGSQQGVHQDGAYVVVSEPLKFAASWIALEDVSEGSGELVYCPRSHRLPDFLFSGQYKSWNPKRDGQDKGKVYLEELTKKIRNDNLEYQNFLPKKGDALIWAADLAHGGSKITNDSTRMSLVTHYCPLSVNPNYKKFSGTFAPLQVDSECYISSRHYDLREKKGRTFSLKWGQRGESDLLKPSFMGKQSKIDKQGIVGKAVAKAKALGR